MPTRPGMYSWLITRLTLNVPITAIPARKSATTPTAPPTSTYAAISGGETTKLPSRTGRRPIRSASGPPISVPSAPATRKKARSRVPYAAPCPREIS